jgi:hypothetical protein
MCVANIVAMPNRVLEIDREREKEREKVLEPCRDMKKCLTSTLIFGNVRLPFKS